MAFYGTCGNIGLKNPMLPMFRSFCAFGSEVHKAVSTGGEMKRKCVVSNDCPPWPKFDCGEQKGLLVEAGDAPAPRLGRAQLRAISGKLVKEQLEKVARDDPCNYRWQGREMWQGKQRWPDPFVPVSTTGRLGLLALESLLHPPYVLQLQGKVYHGAYPLYRHWHTMLPKDTTERPIVWACPGKSGANKAWQLPSSCQ